MTTFTATGVRGVVFTPSGFSGGGNDANQIAFKVDFDFVGVVDPAIGLVYRPTTQLTLVVTGHDFTYGAPSTRPGGPGPSLTGGVITGFAEFDDHDRVIATATDLPQVAAGVQLSYVLLYGVVAGNDDISGSSFADQLNAGEGNDFVRGLDGNDSVYGGAGNDDVNGNVGEDWVSGSAGNDTVRGGQGADTVRGDDGDDGHVNGNLGEDLVSGGEGDDTVYGGQGDDMVHGDDYVVVVASGGDLVSGDLGNDTVHGGLGNDTVLGGDGNDLVSGDEGEDIAWGGAGADRFAFARGFGDDWIGDFNFAEGDRIVLPAGAAYSVTAHVNQVVIDLGGGDALGLVGVPPSAFSSDWIAFG